MTLYYVDSHGGETELLVQGVTKLVSLAKSSRFRHGAVAAHTKDQIAHSNIWEDVIGKVATKTLSKGQVTIDGCTFYLLTERIDPAAFIEGPVLAAAISTQFLNRLLTNRKATDIIFVPWLEEELDDFKHNHADAVRL